MYYKGDLIIMHSNNELTSYAFRAILSHLVDMEERKSEIANVIFGELSTLRDGFDCFIDNYLKKFEELIKTVKIVDKPSR